MNNNLPIINLAMLLASKNIQPIRSSQMVSKAKNQEQPCGIESKEIVVEGGEEQHTNGYKKVSNNLSSS